MMSAEVYSTAGGRISGEVLLVAECRRCKSVMLNLSGKRTDYSFFGKSMCDFSESVASAMLFFVCKKKYYEVYYGEYFGKNSRSKRCG